MSGNQPAITSLQNRRIKAAIKLRHHRQRLKQQRFVIDGLRELRLGSCSEQMVPSQNKVRQLLETMEGITFSELSRPDECCGFGGTFAVNEEAVRRLGYSRDELLSMKPESIDAPEYAAQVPQRIAEIAAAGIVIAADALTPKKKLSAISGVFIGLMVGLVVLLPLAYVVGPVLGYGLLGVWIINGVYRVGQALNCGTQWGSRKWAHIKV